MAVGRRRGTSSGVITNEINVTIQPDVPTHVLTVQVRGPVNLNADMDKDHDEVRSHFFPTHSKDELMTG